MIILYLQYTMYLFTARYISYENNVIIFNRC